MSESTLSAVPAFDAAALVRMAIDVNDRAFTSVFATRYRQMLAGRVNRITSALLKADVDAALDATLSLKVSSVTVGTCELADLALDIEDNVRRFDVTAARTVASRLPVAAARADHALAEYLGLSA
ncbi:hypothetical protein H5V45_21085 [Nocardioides sp. KIGAM211]|uniref:HPt domain-containing protein n=1 Tax=Nocardioides luti TaxID=2761101 RepID=A0A7X0RK66_9ACTN|nr:hypothetical protein [Nocardioides luti]MBB6629826.1 hypothetical protein [Nocardioides luti]